MPARNNLVKLDQISASQFAAIRSEQITTAMDFVDSEYGRVLVKSAKGYIDKSGEQRWKFTTCGLESIDHVAVALYEVDRDRIAYWWIRPAGMVNKKYSIQTIRDKYLKLNSRGCDIVLQRWMKLDV
jgi:hypothetical protein